MALLTQISPVYPCLWCSQCHPVFTSSTSPGCSALSPSSCSPSLLSVPLESNSVPLSPHLNLSLPLQRASSHISLTLHDKREETLLDQVAADASRLESRIQNLESETQARRISVGEAAAPSLPSRNSPNTRASPSQLSRHQSQVEICQTRVHFLQI